MTYVVSTPPATEPITTADVRPFCRLDGSNAEIAPAAVTAALAGAGAGNVDNGVHRYLATYVTASGETEAGIISAAVTVADKTVNGQVSLSVIPTGGSFVTARKLYRTVAGGSTYLLLATIADNVTTVFTDNVADASLGAGAPTLNTTDDPLLLLLIASARAHAEQELRRYLVTQTIDAFYDHFPRPARYMDHHGMDSRAADYTTGAGFHSHRYEIRLPPLQSVSSITYIDQNGVLQTLDPATYIVDAKSQPARITPAFGQIWPATQWQANAITIRFVAGYGAAAAVPACIRQWMLMRVSTMFENREQLSVGHTRSALIEVPPSYIDGLLDPERWGGRT